MGDTPQPPQWSDRTRTRAVVLGIVTSVMATKAVEKALTRSLGEWGAFGIGVLGGCVVGMVVAMLVYKLAGRGK